MIKNVLFDIDDTLYDHQFASSQAIQSLASNYYRITGFNEPLKFIQAYYRVKSELDGLNPKSFDKTSHFLKIIRLANREGKVDLAKELGKSYWKEILKRTVPYPDVKPTLIILKRQRYQLGIVSDGLIQTQSLRLNKLEFSDLFDIKTFSEEVGVNKPDRRIFRLALKRMKAKIKETVMVGDNVKKDILGAKKLGLHTIWIKRGTFANILPRCKAEEPDNIEEDFTGIPSILKSIP